MRSTTSAACLAKMKDVFARFGLPDEIVSDNGPQSVSSEFKSFTKEPAITHTTSSPFLPNSNGEAERAVRLAKGILRQREPWMALLIHRNTVMAANRDSSTPDNQPFSRVDPVTRKFANTTSVQNVHTRTATIVDTVRARRGERRGDDSHRHASVAHD